MPTQEEVTDVADRSREDFTIGRPSAAWLDRPACIRHEELLVRHNGFRRFIQAQ
jgi:hypothetical protein